MVTGYRFSKRIKARIGDFNVLYRYRDTGTDPLSHFEIYIADRFSQSCVVIRYANEDSHMIALAFRVLTCLPGLCVITRSTWLNMECAR